MKTFLLTLTLLLVMSGCAPTRDLSVAPLGDQRIVLWHKQSGEKISVTTRSAGRYNPEAFEAIDRIFRDRRTGDSYPMDPKLIDVIADLRDKLLMSPDDPIELLSGYRSPESNANLSKINKYVAKNSFHMKGQAADIRIPNMNSSALEAVAKTMQKGGVALYPDSGHVHVDTGPIRGWSVVRGQEAGMRTRAKQVVPVTSTPIHNTVKVKPLNTYDDLPEPALPPESISKKAPTTKANAVKSNTVKSTSVKTKKGEPVRTAPKAAPKVVPKNQPHAIVPHKPLSEARKQWVKSPAPKVTPKKPAPKKPEASKSSPKSSKE